MQNRKLFPSSPIILKIDRFQEKHFRNLIWKSPPFYSNTNGYMFHLRVHCNGHDSSQGYLSLYPVLMSGPNDINLQWPFKGKVTYALLNQAMDSGHYSITTDYAAAGVIHSGKPTKGGENNGRGRSHFFRVDRLAFFHYLQDDCLFFKVTISL